MRLDHPESQVILTDAMVIPDAVRGSAAILRLLDRDPATFRAWAEECFEALVARSAADHIFGHCPLAGAVVKALNPKLNLADLAEDASEIAYPTST